MTHPSESNEGSADQPGFPPPPSSAAPAWSPPPSVPPADGAPAYGAPAYGAPAYGAPAYGAPADGAYSAPGYGAPGYGAPGYGAPEYGYAQAAVPPGMFLDQASQLVLPAGTQLASAGRRIGAWFLSLLLVIVTLVIGYVIWGLIVWGRGQTPALQVLNMRVWRPEGNKPASFGYMALREIVGRFVDGVLSIVTGLISFIMMLATKERRTLHDLVAGTVVLYDPNKVLGS